MCIYIYIYTCKWTYIHIRTYIYIYICMYVYVCTYTYIYIHTYIWKSIIVRTHVLLHKIYTSIYVYIYHIIQKSEHLWSWEQLFLQYIHKCIHGRWTWIFDSEHLCWSLLCSTCSEMSDWGSVMSMGPSSPFVGLHSLVKL